MSLVTRIVNYGTRSLVSKARLHLGIGSQQPPKVDGKLRLYSMELCPFAQRTRMVLNAKGIPYDIVDIDIFKKPEWYFLIHPDGRVPALDTGSEIIIESLVISDYLDQQYPNPPLYFDKTRDQELIDKLHSLVKLFFRCIWRKEEKSPVEWAKDFSAILGNYESELKARGVFFGGARPGMVDYMLWPWAERAGLIERTIGQKVPFDPEKFTNLRKWGQAMKTDRACTVTCNDLDKHWKVAQAKLDKVPVDLDNL